MSSLKLWTLRYVLYAVNMYILRLVAIAEPIMYINVGQKEKCCTIADGTILTKDGD